MNDYSARFDDPKQLAAEDAAWREARFHYGNAYFVAYAALQYGIKSVLEMGCGTGLAGREIIRLGVKYLGVDKAPLCVAKASARCRGQVVEGDVRTRILPAYDLCCAFAFTKHFGLHEWDQVVARLLSFAPYCLFSQPVGPQDEDTGTEVMGFHHVFVTQARARAVIEAAGHELLMQEPMWSDGERSEDVFLTSKR